MTSATVALTVFTTFNFVRLVGYIPQIVKILRDQHGAHAVSITTWVVFALSHLSTVAYAILCVEDWTMAYVFGANTAFCTGIVVLTASKRVMLGRIRPDSTGTC